MYQDITVSGSMPEAKALRPKRQERRKRMGRDERETFQGEESEVRRRPKKVSDVDRGG
jgi:hypothetical protein